MWETTSCTSWSETNAPCIRVGSALPGCRNSKSPYFSKSSAPIWSRMVRLSILLCTVNAIRVGILALIRPVITSTLGRWVAIIRWMPAARAFCAKRAICCSTDLRSVIIRSANSSITTTIKGSLSKGSGSSGLRLNGLSSGLPSAFNSSTFLLKPSILRTPACDSKR